jgi:hypothetical protein
MIFKGAELNPKTNIAIGVSFGFAIFIKRTLSESLANKFAFHNLIGKL